MASGNLSPRQKMINLMYLIFIAMIAMQMSKEVLSAFGYMNEKLTDNNITASAKNSATLDNLATKAQEQPEKYNSLYSTAKKVDELSKGMKMKYALALALSHNAKLLILDEPTSGLDPVARDNLLEIFQSVVEEGEVSILFSTHITSDLEKCADYITFIKDGKLIESSTKDDLIDKYRLVNGTKEQLSEIKDQMIAYKENAFGFNGLIETKDVKETGVRYGVPSLDDIMIYYSGKEVL